MEYHTTESQEPRGVEEAGCKIYRLRDRWDKRETVFKLLKDCTNNRYKSLAHSLELYKLKQITNSKNSNALSQLGLKPCRLLQQRSLWIFPQRSSAVKKKLAARCIAPSPDITSDMKQDISEILKILKKKTVCPRAAKIIEEPIA